MPGDFPGLRQRRASNSYSVVSASDKELLAEWWSSTA